MPSSEAQGEAILQKLRVLLEEVATVKESTCVWRFASFNPKLDLFEKMGAAREQDVHSL